jgi:hypothetical protein
LSEENEGVVTGELDLSDGGADEEGEYSDDS